MLTPPSAPLNLTRGPGPASSAALDLVWTAPSSTGGSPVLTYTLELYNPTLSPPAWQTVSTSLTALTYSQATPVLAPGQTYQVKVAARNRFGLSSYSEELSFLAAGSPPQMAAPSLVLASTGVNASFSLLDTAAANHSPVTQYSLVWEASSGSDAFAASCPEAPPEDWTRYGGADPVNAPTLASCYVQMLAFSDPAGNFSLAAGASLRARVKAANSFGEGVFSDWSAPLTVATLPAAPPAPPSRGAGTGPDKVEVAIGLFNLSQAGHSPVLSYAVDWDAGSGAASFHNFAGQQRINLAASVSLYHSPDDGVSLVPGQAYSFRYRVLNIYGWGPYSPAASIVAAQTPADLLEAPSSALVAPPASDSAVPAPSSVLLAWSAPSTDGGSPVTGYLLEVLHSDGTSYSTPAACSDPAALAAGRNCSLAMATLTAAPFSLNAGQLLKARVKPQNAIGPATAWSPTTPDAKAVAAITAPSAP